MVRLRAGIEGHLSGLAAGEQKESDGAVCREDVTAVPLAVPTGVEGGGFGTGLGGCVEPGGVAGEEESASVDLDFVVEERPGLAVDAGEGRVHEQAVCAVAVAELAVARTAWENAGTELAPD